jgi:rare lipoprotein A
MRRRHTRDRFARLLSLAAFAALLAAGGCSRLPSRDGGPSYSGDFSSLPDPVPHYEPPSPYGNPDSYVVDGKTYHVLASSKGYVARGIASWYGTKFHGQRTSSGETYDMYAMTAAHRTLPLPTYARVTNLRNGRSVIVRINDRGPFHSNRIIDLSYAAASKLGIVEEGTGLVQVEAIDPRAPKRPATTVAAAKPKTGQPQGESRTSRAAEKEAAKAKAHDQDATAVVKAAAVAPAPSAATPLPAPTRPAAPSGAGQAALYLQVGAFSSESNAERLRRKLESSHVSSVSIQEGESGDHPVYRVRVGPIPSVDAADALAGRLTGLGIENPQVIVD